MTEPITVTIARRPAPTAGTPALSAAGGWAARWRQTITIFLVFFPVSVIANWLLGPLVKDWPLPLRVLGVMVVTLPFMTYLGLPWITRQMEWFLQGRRPRWRQTRA
ncbi:hypothetical protein [Nocardioides sp.]|uniref:hypothetical protein n=1 Tax=Nocardioides sp. TaxID=35761 RepID=UPI0039E4ED81